MVLRTEMDLAEELRNNLGDVVFSWVLRQGENAGTTLIIRDMLKKLTEVAIRGIKEARAGMVPAPLASAQPTRKAV